VIFEEFKETYNWAPYPIEEFAEGAQGVTDNTELADAGRAFVLAKMQFEQALKDAGIEIG